MSAACTLRELQPRDLPGLLAVQRACYGEDFVEDAEVFARRLAQPAHCSLAMATQQGEVCAYLVAYRSSLGSVTPLNGDFDPAAQPDTLYLHDMAVAPAWAGRGLAAALLERAIAQACAERLAHSALVAVQGSQPWWRRRGYTPHALAEPQQQRRLAGYGAQAVYMRCSLLN